MDFAERFAVAPGSKVDLSKFDPADTDGFKKGDEVQERVAKNLDCISKLQYDLYAENKRSLLIVLQAMDAGGKDGTIRHVCSAMNPQGCHVTAFKAPTPEELEHDFLWRIHREVPRRGEIGVFNRSHYEDVLVVRVHNLAPKEVWSKRYDKINVFEEFLSDAGTHILKFFLHISKAEQLERLKARVVDPQKRWKVSLTDFEERKFWDDYQQAFEAALGKCSTKHAPWYIIPADKKWFRNLAVSEIVADAMKGFNMQTPEPTVDLTKIKIE